jgi:protein-S-isoprenylcysteine O-methyltransferase Ste14
MHLDPWDLFFLAGFIVFVAIRGVYKARTKRNEKVVRRVDTTEILLLLFLVPGSLLLPMIYLFSPWIAFADYPLPAPVRTGGAALLVFALWLFWRSHADLAQNWSVTLEIRKGHQLVKHGVYRSIRHPMYASIWLWCMGQGLILENWLAGWYFIPGFSLLYFIRTPREERMLSDFFGDEYREYMRHTGRLWPRLR